MILKKGEVLFSQEEESDIYVLKRGLLKANRLQPNGSCLLFNLLIPGEVFPHHSLITPTRTFGTVLAMVESEIQVTSKWVWYEELEQNPHRYREVALHLQSTIKRIQQRTQLLLAPPKERIYLFRKWMEELGYEIESVLTQEEVGQFLGLTRETVNRFMQKERRGNG